MNRNDFKMFGERLYSHDEIGDLLDAIEAYGALVSIPNGDAIKIGGEWYCRYLFDSICLAVKENWNSEPEMLKILNHAARCVIPSGILAGATKSAFDLWDVIQPSKMVASGLGSIMYRHGVRAPFHWAPIPFDKHGSPPQVLEWLQVGTVSANFVSRHYAPMEDEADYHGEDLREIWEILRLNGLVPQFGIDELDYGVFKIVYPQSKWPRRVESVSTIDDMVF